MLLWLSVAVGGAIGSMARHGVDSLVVRVAGGFAVVSRADLIAAGLELDGETTGVRRVSSVRAIASAEPLDDEA